MERGEHHKLTESPGSGRKNQPKPIIKFDFTIENNHYWAHTPVKQLLLFSLAAAAAHIYDYSITPRSGAKRLHMGLATALAAARR